MRHLLVGLGRILHYAWLMLARFVPHTILFPVALIIIAVPIEMLLYACHLFLLGQILAWTVAFISTTLFFIFWVGALLALKVIRQGVNFATEFPRLALFMFGSDRVKDVQFGISEKYVTDFKATVAGGLAWVMFFTFIIAALPYHLVPLGLIITYIAFLFMATRQEGWIQKPPRLMQWLAGFLALSLLTSVFMKMFLPETATIISQEINTVDDYAAHQLKNVGSWLKEKTSEEETVVKQDSKPSNASPTIGAGFERTHYVIRTKYAEEVRKQLVVIATRRKQGKDTRLEELAIKRNCFLLTRKDLEDRDVREAFRRYCETSEKELSGFSF